MKIAIVGAGFCGLSLSYFFLQSKTCEVTLFDTKGIGGGASGVATGLLHPYPGEQGRRSWKASEGIGATLALLKKVEEATGRTAASYDGILRVVQNEEQKAGFLSHIEQHGDVELIDEESFLIKSGVTVHCQSYLQGLWEMVSRAGGILVQKAVKSLSDLEAYDQIVLTAGGGISGFSEASKLRFSCTKGQVLKAEVPPFLQNGFQSIIGKGYLAKGDRPDVCYIGSTYERPFVSDCPDRLFAEKEILPKAALFFPQTDQLRILGCSAGVRVTRVGHYYPIIARFSPTNWALTAMGSRGLMYHAFLAELLSQAILTADDACIPSEVLINAMQGTGVHEEVCV
ncbi:MAG: FAD-binding oxidoreductase [Verrucomicrobia bacterium]|nr:FAD-binding oxidoreductase [Verrucomicrobiota bacterium]